MPAGRVPRARFSIQVLLMPVGSMALERVSVKEGSPHFGHHLGPWEDTAPLLPSNHPMPVFRAKRTGQGRGRRTDFAATPGPWSRLTEQFATIATPQLFSGKCRSYTLAPGFVFFSH